MTSVNEIAAAVSRRDGAPFAHLPLSGGGFLRAAPSDGYVRPSGRLALACATGANQGHFTNIEYVESNLPFVINPSR